MLNHIHSNWQSLVKLCYIKLSGFKQLKKYNLNSIFIISSALVAALLTSCGTNERWLANEKLFKNEKWLLCKESLSSSHRNDNEFFLKITRKDVSVSGTYVDKFNEIKAKIHESPTSLTASMNIQQHPGTKIFSQLVIRINRQDLSYSKKINSIQKDSYGDWGSVGGINIPNAGTCTKSDNPPKQII